MRSLIQAGLAALLLLGFSLPAAAQEWPAKPLTLIVPFGPGSSPDVMSRLIADQASKTLGQTIVVQNRPGASGNLGTSVIAKAAPDGYTFGVSITGPMVNNTVLYKELPYDPKQDIAPLTLGVHQPNILVVPASSPIKSLDDLLAAVKDPKSQYNFPSTGAGTISHLSVELLLERAGGQAVHVPYPSSPAAVTSLVAGDTHFAALPPIAVMPLVNDGRLRALAVVYSERVSFLPDTPTVAELGLEGIEGSGWIGFVAPSGIPKDIKAKLTNALIDAIHNPDVQARLHSQFMEPVGNQPEEFAQYMDAELQRWAPLIKRLNLSVN
ncbi:Bug family tripartite tricarboxylate transporter substrate binding protein [Pollutimonas harenae]|uniref:Tripartite tricarboxylate transporter substrate binding protein n=1 Tax=Pollutimonas harenae TaxID=657015 RepID=A0A853H5J2_9BURK|nr:tripartite tricarboxylate transporter substrate binding protein [Pollutimonas harenae]NYT85374.1 tripartite tricarboxylate transporter substrate binding protein [Pollutimonas harenae]TEA70474.1 tripartite tricarboxylate transporter substrate binding protein [Pollutimonas harenae]